MAFPQAEQNGVFTQVNPGVDLGLAATLATNATSTGTNFSTGAPCTVVVLSRLVSGGATVNVAVNSGTPTYPGQQMVMSGTTRQFTAVNTSAANLFCGIQEVCTGNAGFEEMAIMVCYRLEPGEDWFNIRSGAMAVMNQYTGDGTGFMNLFFK